MRRHPRTAASATPAAAALIAALIALAGCSKPKELYVDHAWVRLPAVAGRPGAAYFTIHGGPRDATLIDVTSDVAIRSEMHETTGAKGTGAAGMSGMAPMPSVPIPARSLDAFAPGGRHVMLFDISPAIKPGASMTLTFTFGNGERIIQIAPAIAAGDPAPKG